MPASNEVFGAVYKPRACELQAHRNKPVALVDWRSPFHAGWCPTLPVIGQLLEHIGVDVVGVADYEAEDVIPILTRLAAGNPAPLTTPDEIRSGALRSGEIVRFS